MTNSENPTSDPNPGYLAGDMGSFTPPLPAGSWERLQARGKRRRLAAFWWTTLLLLSVTGLGGYGVYSHMSNPNNLTPVVAGRSQPSSRVGRNSLIDSPPSKPAISDPGPGPVEAGSGRPYLQKGYYPAASPTATNLTAPDQVGAGRRQPSPQLGRYPSTDLTANNVGAGRIRPYPQPSHNPSTSPTPTSPIQNQITANPTPEILGHSAHTPTLDKASNPNQPTIKQENQICHPPNQKASPSLKLFLLKKK